MCVLQGADYGPATSQSLAFLGQVLGNQALLTAKCGARSGRLPTCARSQDSFSSAVRLSPGPRYWVDGLSLTLGLLLHSRAIRFCKVPWGSQILVSLDTVSLSWALLQPLWWS